MNAEEAEREVLADLLMSDRVMKQPGLGRDYAYVEADAILAAGFRQQRAITDTEVWAARELLTDHLRSFVSDSTARAALEAARDLR